MMMGLSGSHGSIYCSSAGLLLCVFRDTVPSFRLDCFLNDDVKTHLIRNWCSSLVSTCWGGPTVDKYIRWRIKQVFAVCQVQTDHNSLSTNYTLKAHKRARVCISGVCVEHELVTLQVAWEYGMQALSESIGQNTVALKRHFSTASVICW